MKEITNIKLNAPMEKQWYTVTELALYLGLTEPSIRAKLQRGEIDYEKLGKRVLIKRDVVENLVGNSLN
ncbi:MAG: helix-turn-helix domain-containing protein [Candidatus Marinimicrobia bacterium]|nr:helix-turn-helix domain-containing protein [Candidatus Brocadiales bacterium]MBL7046673.1 helix-turn-helix domain-containing protein [Candidatus Neomarinimicrobiota bacterium]